MPELITDFGKPLVDIREGKHPCLDTVGISYIPNDTLIDPESRLIILTGPNMGGKSTLMRQTGLLVILAQIGCMVPAQQMTLTPVDRIFTRLGAEDNIIGGESTFLVELQVLFLTTVSKPDKKVTEGLPPWDTRATYDVSKTYLFEIIGWGLFEKSPISFSEPLREINT